MALNDLKSSITFFLNLPYNDLIRFLILHLDDHFDPLPSIKHHILDHTHSLLLMHLPGFLLQAYDSLHVRFYPLIQDAQSIEV